MMMITTMNNFVQFHMNCYSNESKEFILSLKHDTNGTTDLIYDKRGNLNVLPLTNNNPKNTE